MTNLLKELDDIRATFRELKGEAAGLGNSMSNLNNATNNQGRSSNDITNINNDAGNAQVKLTEKFKKTAIAVDMLCDAVKSVINLANASNNEITGKVNIAQQVNKIKFEQKHLEQQLNIKKQEFDFQKESRKLSAERSNIEKQKADLSLIEQANIKIAQADLALRQANMAVEQADLGIKQAKLSLAQAGIAAARAEIDYQDRLLQIEIGIKNARKGAVDAQKNYIKELEGLYEPWIKIDQAASTYTKTIGGSAISMGQLKKETVDFVNTEHLQAKYNTSAEELITLQQKYNAEIGRSIKLTNSEKESLAALKQVYGDEKTIEFATKLATFGYDINRASGLAGKMFANASKHGVALDKFSKNLLSNMKMAQTLSFDKGVKGLQSMAEKASELNFNMQETAKAADKLSTLEGAMEAAAGLSTLGGNFSLYSNPLAMMNDALNDADALQDRIISQFSDLAYWDSDKGEITMDGVARQKMKAAAQYMGMDPTEISNLAFNKARMDKLSPEVDRLSVDDDIKHLLKNVAQLDERGNGYVNIGGKKVSLQEASMMNPEKLASALRAQNNSDSDNIKDIAQNVLSIKDSIDGWSKAVGDSLASSIDGSGIGLGYVQMLKQQSTSREYLSELARNMAESGKEVADINKRNAEWQHEKALATADYERQSAALQKQQTAYAYESAKFGLKSAEFGKESAILNQRGAKINNDLSKFALQEAQLQLAQIDLANRQALFDINEKLPLDEARNLMEMENLRIASFAFEAQLAQLKLQQAQLEYETGNSFWSIVGGIAGAAIGLLIPGGGALLAAAGYYAGKSIGGTIGGIGNSASSYASGVLKSNEARGYMGDIDKSLDDSWSGDGYATGGIVNRGKRFDTGGMTSIGGVILGPTHADGGVQINAQGGEYIMPVEQTKIYYSQLEDMRHKTFPVGNGGYNGMSVSSGGSTVYTGNNFYGGSSRPTEPLKLDVTGTITLNLSGDTTNINAEELLREPYLSQIVNAISRSQNNLRNGGNSAEINLFDPTISGY